ncbi:MAG TPA: hypothetical protein V6C81_14730 [Planktothrix sp.]|jgi:hypothetical protein
MSLEQIQLNYADATGFVVDRTTNPPKVLGQAFLISRNRAVTCASSVYNYSEAPWALALNFVHPDVVVSVKGMVIHPEFDKKAARTWYLNQTGNPGEQCVLNNDMATIVLDSFMPDMPQDKVGELNRALSLPFNSQGVEASGSIRGSDFLNILGGILQANRTGLVTLFDGRNIPLARLQVGPNAIQKVYFRGLLGELAFFELLYRQPAEGYSFQSGDVFNWGNVRDITAPADALVAEAQRRVDELPGMFQYLGGPGSRYQQRIENYDASNASETIAWFSERLWTCIDGYLTLDNLSERAGVDTFTVLQAIREMVNKAQISMINRKPFHCGGQIGTPLVSHTDFEVNAWDPLQAFFLDPLSGRPVWLQGNFFGVANALQPKNMLHTIAMPNNVPGAMILKDYKLIGIHDGPHAAKPGQPVPPVKCFQFMWMGALLDITAKKGRSDDEDGQAMSGLRSKAATEIEEGAKPAVPAEKLEKYVCPNCYTTNTQVGPCFNCGTQIAAPEPDPDEVASKPSTTVALKKIQEKTKLSNQHLIGIAVVLCIVAILVVPSLLAPPNNNTAPPAATSSDHQSSEKAMKVAVENAGFKATAVPGYWYEDTSDITKPQASFGLYSEQSNQKLIFVVIDDTSPIENLSNFCGLPPFCDVYRASNLTDIKLDEGSQLLGDGALKYFVGRYDTKVPSTDGHFVKESILIGSFPSPKAGKSILIIGRAFDAAKGYDYKTALWLCDQMGEDFTAHGNATRTGGGNVVTGTATSTSTSTSTGSEEKPFATDAQVDTFIKSMQTHIQGKLKVPDDVVDEMKKHHPQKLKAALTVTVSCTDGSITKMEINDQSDFESQTNALQRAVSSSAPFDDPPRVKDGSLTVKVSINKDKIKVERQ